MWAKVVEEVEGGECLSLISCNLYTPPVSERKKKKTRMKRRQKKRMIEGRKTVGSFLILFPMMVQFLELVPHQGGPF